MSRISPTTQYDAKAAFDNLQARDANGVVGVVPALLCTVYLRHDFPPERRRAIREVIQRYVELAKDGLRWLMPTKKGARRVDASTIAAALDANLASIEDSDDSWELHLHGGEQPQAASDLGIDVFLRARWEQEPPPNQLSYLSFRFPVLWFADKRPGFPSFVLRACEQLEPLHGYGGIGLITAADRSLASHFTEMVAALAERFPGLEIDYPVSHLIWVRAGIKGVNWLTILGEGEIERFGGLDVLKAALPPAATLHAYSGGMMIQASPMPQIGDRNRQVDVDDYRTVAVALKPIRISTHGGVGGGGFDRERFERWLARFDQY
ncbi:MAG TPA: type VI immunity family protein [Gemmatimonadaceae bacterium]